MPDPTLRPPRDNIVRATAREVIFRAASTEEGADARNVMTGHFAVFNRWTEIDSLWEGRFLERIAPGSFKKTFSENRSAIKVLFQHGYDFRVGDKPIATIDELREDDTGAYYETPLLEAGYVREDVLPGLEAGVYGASFRFRVMKEEFEDRPEASDDNPERLPERTIKEVQVYEFGPVTFPAYADATAGLRSMSDEDLISRMFHRDPLRFRELLASMGATLALPGAGAAPTEHSSEGSRNTAAPVNPSKNVSREDFLAWIVRT